MLFTSAKTTYNHKTRINQSHGITVGVLGVTDPGTNVPEPASLALLGGALGALAMARRKR